MSTSNNTDNLTGSQFGPYVTQNIFYQSLALIAQNGSIITSYNPAAYTNGSDPSIGTSLSNFLANYTSFNLPHTWASFKTALTSAGLPADTLEQEWVADYEYILRFPQSAPDPSSGGEWNSVIQGIANATGLSFTDAYTALKTSMQSQFESAFTNFLSNYPYGTITNSDGSSSGAQYPITAASFTQAWYQYMVVNASLEPNTYASTPVTLPTAAQEPPVYTGETQPTYVNNAVYASNTGTQAFPEIVNQSGWQAILNIIQLSITEPELFGDIQLPGQAGTWDDKPLKFQGGQWVVASPNTSPTSTYTKPIAPGVNIDIFVSVTYSSSQLALAAYLMNHYATLASPDLNTTVNVTGLYTTDFAAVMDSDPTFAALVLANNPSAASLQQQVTNGTAVASTYPPNVSSEPNTASSTNPGGLSDYDIIETLVRSAQQGKPIAVANTAGTITYVFNGVTYTLNYTAGMANVALQAIANPSVLTADFSTLTAVAKQAILSVNPEVKTHAQWDAINASAGQATTAPVEQSYWELYLATFPPGFDLNNPANAAQATSYRNTYNAILNQFINSRIPDFNTDVADGNALSTAFLPAQSFSQWGTYVKGRLQAAIASTNISSTSTIPLFNQQFQTDVQALAALTVSDPLPAYLSAADVNSLPDQNITQDQSNQIQYAYWNLSNPAIVSTLPPVILAAAQYLKSQTDANPGLTFAAAINTLGTSNLSALSAAAKTVLQSLGVNTNLRFSPYQIQQLINAQANPNASYPASVLAVAADIFDQAKVEVAASIANDPTKLWNVVAAFAGTGGPSSVNNDPGRKLTILNDIFALIVQMIGILQNVAAAQSDRLNILADWQQAYIARQNQIHSFTKNDGSWVDGATDSGGNAAVYNGWTKGRDSADGQTYRSNNIRDQLNNTINANLIQVMQNNRGVISDTAKSLQSNVNTTSDAVNQQSNMANTILQQLQTLLNAIFK